MDNAPTERLWISDTGTLLSQIRIDFCDVKIEHVTLLQQA